MKLRSSAFSILVFSISLILHSCGLNCIEGTGEMVSDKRPIDGAEGVELNLDADVSIVKGDVEVINIVAQQNILEKIKTDVDDGIVKISSEGCFDSHEPIKILVTVPDIKKLELNGSGRIWVPDTFAVDEVELVMNGSGTIDAKLIAANIESKVRGSGRIVLAGSANVQSAVIAGSGDILGEKLPCNEAEVKIAGSGNASVYAIKTLEIKIAGSGTVKYKGKPELKSNVTGSGKVVDDN